MKFKVGDLVRTRDARGETFIPDRHDAIGIVTKAIDADQVPLTFGQPCYEVYWLNSDSTMNPFYHDEDHLRGPSEI